MNTVVGIGEVLKLKHGDDLVRLKKDAIEKSQFGDILVTWYSSDLGKH